MIAVLNVLISPHEVVALVAPRHISLAPVSSAYFWNELSCHLTTGSRLRIFRTVENGVGLVPRSRRCTSIASDHQGRLRSGPFVARPGRTGVASNNSATRKNVVEPALSERRSSWALPPRPPSTYVLSRSRLPQRSSPSCDAGSRRRAGLLKSSLQTDRRGYSWRRFRSSPATGRASTTGASVRRD